MARVAQHLSDWLSLLLLSSSIWMFVNFTHKSRYSKKPSVEQRIKQKTGYDFILQIFSRGVVIKEMVGSTAYLCSGLLRDPFISHIRVQQNVYHDEWISHFANMSICVNRSDQTHQAKYACARNRISAISTDTNTMWIQKNCIRYCHGYTNIFNSFNLAYQYAKLLSITDVTEISNAARVLCCNIRSSKLTSQSLNLVGGFTNVLPLRKQALHMDAAIPFFCISIRGETYRLNNEIYNIEKHLVNFNCDDKP